MNLQKVCRFGSCLSGGLMLLVNLAHAQAAENSVDWLNAELAAMGEDVRVVKIELLGYDLEAGRTIVPTRNCDQLDDCLASDRGNKQLGADFVPGDPRRDAVLGGGTSILYALDTFDLSNGVANIPAQNAAIRSAMDTWNAAQCSDIPLVETNTNGTSDIGFAEWLVTSRTSGSSFIFSDVNHAGFLPAPTFAFLAFVLGQPDGNFAAVTVTFAFADASGNPTDIDNDGKSDVAFTEIYYNNLFMWSTDGGFCRLSILRQSPCTKLATV